MSCDINGLQAYLESDRFNLIDDALYRANFVKQAVCHSLLLPFQAAGLTCSVATLTIDSLYHPHLTPANRSHFQMRVQTGQQIYGTIATIINTVRKVVAGVIGMLSLTAAFHLSLMDLKPSQEVGPHTPPPPQMPPVMILIKELHVHPPR